MAGETWPPGCHFCGRFISYHDLEVAVCWTPHGDGSMTEPPPPEFAHLTCWEKADSRQIALIQSIAWQKPHHGSRAAIAAAEEEE